MIDTLIALANVTDGTYCCIDQGEASCLRTGKVFKAELMMYQTMPPDGLYKVTEATCEGSGGCAVGKPKVGCTAYSKQKCAVYSLELQTPQTTVFISLQDLNCFT